MKSEDDLAFFPERSDSEIYFEVFGGNFGDFNCEKFLLSVAKSWLCPGDSVMDAGANHGQHARLFSKMIEPGGTLFCFEADPNLCESLSRGAALSANQIVVVNAALGFFESDQVVKFHRHKTRDQEGSLFLRQEVDIYETVEVEGRNLDDFIVPDLKFLKIDVEGAEFGLIRGAREVLSRSAPLVAIELTRNPGVTLDYTRDTFMNLVQEIGYDLFNIRGQLISAESWADDTFFMNHQNWMAKKGSSAHQFALTQIPKFANAFSWGSTDNLPYPFKLVDFPV